MPYVPKGAWNFISKINRDGPIHPSLGSKCWVWKGYKFSDGYGGVMVQYSFMRAHRYSWEVHESPIPKGMWVLHKCDNPLCVNPAHLFLGTALDNKRDCINKDRHIKGSKHWCSKLDDNKVRRIRSLYRYGCRGRGAGSLAKMFNVSKPVILGIINGHGWRHVR